MAISLTKDDVIATCVVPVKMRNDKYEPVTQTEYTAGLKAAVCQLGLTISDLEEIRDGKLTIAELRAIVGLRHMK